MIKISSATYTPTTGIGNFTYSWSSANDCVSFTNPIGAVTNGGSFSTDVFAKDLTCFSYGVDSIQLTIVQENGCETVHLFYPSNPCTLLNVSDIGQGPNDLDFSATAYGGDPNYSFNWNVSPAGLFTVSTLSTSSNSSGYTAIHLTPLNKVPKQPDSFTLYCTVTDANGCRAQSQRTFSLRGVNLSNINANAFCIYEGNAIPSKFELSAPKPGTTKTYSAGPINLFADSVPGCLPDWSTVEFFTPDPDILIDVSSDPVTVTFYAIKETSFKNNILSIPFTVRDCKGANSNESNIIISKGICQDTNNPCPLIVDDLCITNCDSVFTINLEDIIKSPNCCSSNSIDWSTLDVLPGTPIPPATVEYNAGTHSLTYTANGSTSLADLITWSVSDALGNHSGINYIQIARVCPQSPSCSNDCYYVSQNAVDQPLHVLENDLGPNLVPSTLILTVIPTHGTAYVSGGDIFYTPFSTFEGDDTLSYKIYNSDGLSCTAVVTLHIAPNGPAGTGNTIITCTEEILITNDVLIEGVSATGKFDVTFTAFLNDNDPLDDGDELDVQIYVSGSEIASATLLVGEDFTTTVKTGTDDNWLTGDNFAQYLTPDVLTKTELITGQTLEFDKRSWALANNYINKYDDDVKTTTPITAAKEVIVKMKARSLANGVETTFASDIVEKVKIFAFEDTWHLGEDEGNANNSGTWAWEGAAGTKNKGATCNSTTCHESDGMVCEYHATGTCGLASFYSEATIDACPDYGTAEEKNMKEYKLVGSSAVTGLSTSFTTEVELRTLLNSYNATWQMAYKAYDYLQTPHNLWGHQASYLNSKYMLASEPELEYFIIEYVEPATCNEGIQARCTTTSHILF